jgi:hypothetical protein
LAKGLAHLVRTGAQDESVLQFDRVRPARSARKRRPLIVAAIVVALVLSAAIVWFLRQTRHWTVESSRAFISTLALEDYPAFSPTGTTLAYASGPLDGRRQIYTRNLSGGEGIKVTEDGYDDVSPVWSSDGAHCLCRGQPG